MAAKSSEGTKKIEPGSDLPLMCFLSLLWLNKILHGSEYFELLQHITRKNRKSDFASLVPFCGQSELEKFSWRARVAGLRYGRMIRIPCVQWFRGQLPFSGFDCGHAHRSGCPRRAPPPCRFGTSSNPACNFPTPFPFPIRPGIV
jgi:hypothetical protein